MPVSAMLGGRRRLIHRDGRPMALRRITGTKPPAYATVTLLGVRRMFTVEGLKAGVQQGDAVVEALNDELAAAGWTPPHSGDLLDDWQVLGSEPVYHGEILIGHRLHVRGGTP